MKISNSLGCPDGMFQRNDECITPSKTPKPYPGNWKRFLCTISGGHIWPHISEYRGTFARCKRCDRVGDYLRFSLECPPGFVQFQDSCVPEESEE